MDCVLFFNLLPQLQIHPFFCSVEIVLGLLNIFPLPEGTEALSVEGAGETLQRERVFTSWCHYAHSSGSGNMRSFPASSSCSAHGFPSLKHLSFFQHKVPARMVTSCTQWPAPFHFLGGILRCFPMNSFPQRPGVTISGKFQRVDFQKVPPTWHHREFSAIQ